MRASVAAWEKGGQDAARVAFAALGSLNLAWLGMELFSSQGGDIRGGLGKLARELVVMSVLYALIAFGSAARASDRRLLRTRRMASGAGRGGPDLERAAGHGEGQYRALSSGEVGYLEVCGSGSAWPW